MADQVGTKLEARQGIFLGGDKELFKILGETGATYACEGSPAIVPDKNLWGHTREFVRQWRELNLGLK